MLSADLAEQFDNEMAAQTMTKCTKDCFMSMQEEKLLPTEDRCLRNCFVKVNSFNKYFESELRYVTRNVKF